MLLLLRPIVGDLCRHYNIYNINLYYYNYYYYARPMHHNNDIRHHFACYSAKLNTASVLVEHLCQIIIMCVAPACDPIVLMQQGRCVG